MPSGILSLQQLTMMEDRQGITNWSFTELTTDVEGKSWRQISTAAEGYHICVMLGSYSSRLNQHVSTGPGFVSFFAAHKLEIYPESLLLMLKHAWNEHAQNRETLVLFEDSTNTTAECISWFIQSTACLFSVAADSIFHPCIHAWVLLINMLICSDVTETPPSPSGLILHPFVHLSACLWHPEASSESDQHVIDSGAMSGDEAHLLWVSSEMGMCVLLGD